MAASTKFDFPSSFSDGSTHPNGQRGPHSAASLERPGSFREGNESRVSSLFPSTSRTVSLPSQADGVNLLQTLVSDLKTTVLDQKLPRPGEVRRTVTSVFGISAEDALPGTSIKPLYSSSVDEIKRLRNNLHEGSVKARDRAKAFGEAAFKMDKFCTNPPRKRTRNDNSSIERSHATLPGGNASKMGPQTHLTASSLDLGPQKSEERARNAVPNRRMRTSLVEMDARANSVARQSGNMDKDRDAFKLVNCGATQSEEKGRGLPTVVDGWEKSKMKKKRSVMKSDASGSAVLAKPHDGDREPKRGMQQKLVTDARPRVNNTHGFRPNGREDNHAYSPTSVMKMTTSVRGPRSNSGSVSKAASPDTNRVLGNSDDCEHSQCMNKSNGVVGVVNRKRSTSLRSSSPPIAQWGGQRPQKITRVARRSNLPLVTSRDEYSISEMHDNAAVNDDGLGFPRRSYTNASQQSKSKSDHVLSESEESGVIDNKSKDKSKKCIEIEEKSGSSVQKVAALVLPSRKNKMVSEEDQDDSTQRHGKIGRGVSPARPGMPTAEKLDIASTTKQMRSARTGNEKIESKSGRPPTKKWSERKGMKGHTRPRPSVNGGPLDLSGEADDDHEELLAAAKAALNREKACSGEFWKEVEEVFRFLSAEDTDFLNEQIRITEEAAGSTCGTGCGQSLKDDFKYNSLSTIPSVSSRDDSGGKLNGLSSLNERVTDPARQTNSTEPFLEELIRENGSHTGVSICQALLSAIIEEEEIDNLNHQSYGKEDYLYGHSYGTSFEVDSELKSRSFSFQSSGTFQAAERPALNYKANSSWENDEPVHEDTGSNGMLDESLPNFAMSSSTVCSEYEYNQMSINDRVLLELSEIGLYPEHVPYLEQSDDEDIDEGISSLTEKLHELVAKKKRMLLTLGKTIKEARKSQQRELESISMDKLVEIAYEKYMASGSKNMARTNKQATQAFIKRTLARYRKFVKTKISCFREPVFRDMFLSVSSHNDGAKDTDLSSSAVAARFAPSRPSDASFTDQNNRLVSQPAQYPDGIRSTNQLTDQICTEDPWSTKLKKKELLLDDVVGSALRAPSGLGSSLVNGTKGKRSEREREGKVQNRDAASRNGTPKISRSAVSNSKVDKKNKTKPKQKTTQLSASVNGFVGQASDTPNRISPSAPKSRETVGGSTKRAELDLLPSCSGTQDLPNDAVAMDLCNLQLPEIDVSDFGAQGQDIASWFDIEEDGLQDHDFMGLQIPMDDLSDVLS